MSEGRKKYLIVGLGVLFVISLGINIKTWSGGKIASTDYERESDKYPLIAKRTFAEDPNDPIVNFVPLRLDVGKYFQENNLDGSFNFEYLSTGVQVTIDEDKREVAASLMKLPAAMDLMKAAELGRVNLDDKVALQESWLDSGFGDLYQKGAGYQLSLRDAVRIMLEDSDNTALKAVSATSVKLIKPEESSLNAVDVEVSQNADLSISISAESYTSFLKCLYYTCYNNKQYSQEILEYLTKSDFNDRIVAGIDNKDVKVAHKIGTSEDHQGDCGIVYLPNRRYILCIMLKGPEGAETDKHFAALSKKVYDYVNKQ